MSESISYLFEVGLFVIVFKVVTFLLTFLESLLLN